MDLSKKFLKMIQKKRECRSQDVKKKQDSDRAFRASPTARLLGANIDTFDKSAIYKTTELMI